MCNRTLGVIAMVCAPALLVEALLRRGEEDPLITGITSMVFMAGFICSNTVLRRMRAAGTGRWGRAVLLVQLAGLVLAFVWGLLEATGLLRETVVYSVTDFAWPLSMMGWTLVVGIAAILARRLSGWRRFVPMACWLCVPIVLGAQLAAGIDSAVFGFGLIGVFWLLLGYVAYSAGEQRVEPILEPAVR